LKQHQHLNINSSVHFFAVNGYSFVSFPLQLCQKVSICYFSLDTTNTNKKSKKFVTIQHQCLNINSSVDFFSLKLVFLAGFFASSKGHHELLFFPKNSFDDTPIVSVFPNLQPGIGPFWIGNDAF